MMMAFPPSDNVGYRPVQISSKSRMCAASSTINNDKASDRPASGDVGTAVICEPLLNEIDCLVGSNFVSNNHLGKLSRMIFTFLMKFIAVVSFVAMTRTFLSCLKIAYHVAYAAVTVDRPSCLDFKMILKRSFSNDAMQSSWNGYVS